MTSWLGGCSTRSYKIVHGPIMGPSCDTECLLQWPTQLATLTPHALGSISCNCQSSYQRAALPVPCHCPPHTKVAERELTEVCCPSCSHLPLSPRSWDVRIVQTLEAPRFLVSTESHPEASWSEVKINQGEKKGFLSAYNSWLKSLASAASLHQVTGTGERG